MADKTEAIILAGMNLAGLAVELFTLAKSGDDLTPEQLDAMKAQIDQRATAVFESIEDKIAE